MDYSKNLIEIINYIYDKNLEDDPSKTITGDMFILENMNQYYKLDRIHAYDKSQEDYRSLAFGNITSKRFLPKVYYLKKQIFFWFARCEIIFNSNTILNEFKLNLTYEKFMEISRIIYIRINLYNVSKKFGFSYDMKLLNIYDHRINNWFTYEEIFHLDNNIKIEEFNEYMDIFSIELLDLIKLKHKKNAFKILKSDNYYTIPFIAEFSKNSITYLNYYVFDHLDNNKIKGKFGNIKGQVFEEIVTTKFNDFILKGYKQLKNYMFNDGFLESEYDLVSLTDDYLWNIDCKGKIFDIYDVPEDNEKESRFLDSYESSYDSINRLHEYCLTNDEIEFYNKNENITFDIKNRKVISIFITLSGLDYLSSSIQKGIISSMKKYKFYPLNINLNDLYMMSFLFKNFDHKFKKGIYKYLIDRFNMINDMKSVEFDIDEIDVMGTMIYNDSVLDIIYQYGKDNIDLHLMIGNSVYRNKYNNVISGIYIIDTIDNYVNENLKDSLYDFFYQAK